ncbi:MAG: ROK family protein [Candidatus Hydrogenedentota bacterium]
MPEFVVGIDLGGTFIKTALVSREKEVVAKDSRPTRGDEGPGAVMEAMQDAVRDLLEQQGATTAQVLAVGIGAPGPLNWQEGIVYGLTNIPGWENVPAAQKMRARLGVPVFLENDANAACYGEFWLGAGQGADNMAVLTLGTGVGGGLVIHSELVRGIDGTAAELGHIKVQRNGRRCGCGAQGCLETYASVTGMIRTAAEAMETRRNSLLTKWCGGDRENLTGKMIYETAVQGDELARWIFEETAAWLGYGISSIINYQNPERIVLCGGMINAGDMLFEPVRRVAKENSFNVPGNRCEILPAGLGSDSGVLGAAGCALTRYERG